MANGNAQAPITPSGDAYTPCTHASSAGSSTACECLYVVQSTLLSLAVCKALNTTTEPDHQYCCKCVNPIQKMKVYNISWH